MNKHGSKWIRPEKRMAIYIRDGFDCVYCRGVFPLGTDLTLDHITPRSLGGSTDASNLVTCCLSCNSSRQDAELRPKDLRRALRAAARPIDIARGKEELRRRRFVQLSFPFATGVVPRFPEDQGVLLWTGLKPAIEERPVRVLVQRHIGGKEDRASGQLDIAVRHEDPGAHARVAAPQRVVRADP